MQNTAVQLPTVEETTEAAAIPASELDQQTDMQVALLRGVLDAMRQPTSDESFKILKDRFSERTLAIHLDGDK